MSCYPQSLGEDETSLKDKSYRREHREAFLKPAFEVSAEEHTHRLLKRLHMGIPYSETHKIQATKAHKTVDCHTKTAKQQLNKCCCLSVLGEVRQAQHLRQKKVDWKREKGRTYREKRRQRKPTA